MEKVVQCVGTAVAAKYLGVSPEVLHRWRQRGIGPAYVLFPHAYDAKRARYWASKRHGMIAYPLEELQRFIERCKVEAGRLPRPVPGRLPVGKNRPRVSDLE